MNDASTPRHQPPSPAADATCVIGAGMSGIAVAAALRARGLQATVYDRRDAIGGLWHHPSPATPGPAYRSLHLNTARSLTSFPDMPMATTLPRYPRHDQVAAYLRDYADRTGVTEVAELGTSVIGIRKSPDGTWLVTSRRAGSTPSTRAFGHLIVATGHHWVPKVPSLPGDETFPGRKLHSFDYSDPGQHADKRVVVIGFGNSAADIAVDLSRIAARTIMVQRRGVHVLPKTLMGIPVDEIAGMRWWTKLTFGDQRRLINLLLRVIRGPLTQYGLTEPDHPLFASAITLSDELLSRISHGDITVKPAIDHITGSTIHFNDGTVEEADDLLYCTGYHIEFPFLPPEWVFDPQGRVALYRQVVSLTRPNLYFAGLIRPFGAVAHLIHAQAAWIADLVEGTAALPPPARMHTEVHQRLTAASARYGSAPYASIQVDYAHYLEALQRERNSATLAAHPE